MSKAGHMSTKTLNAAPKPRRGRKPKPPAEKRHPGISLYLTEEERLLLEEAARRESRDIGEFARVELVKLLRRRRRPERPE